MHKLRASCILLTLLCSACAVSCTRVKIAESFFGTVVDAENGQPLPEVTIQVTVMRVSSFDGASQFRKYAYQSDAAGDFRLPARKKIVESVPEKVEEIQYFEVITFSKRGYAIREFRTDEEHGLFSADHEEPDKIVVRMKKSQGP